MFSSNAYIYSVRSAITDYTNKMSNIWKLLLEDVPLSTCAQENEVSVRQWPSQFRMLSA
jgi:hypothetical protein